MLSLNTWSLTLSDPKLLLLCLPAFSAMSQFRALAGVLRGGRVGGSQWLRGSGGGPTRRWVDPKRGCSSGAAAPVLSAVTSSSSYVEEMYFAWLEDHKNVHEVTVYNMRPSSHISEWQIKVFFCLSMNGDLQKEKCVAPLAAELVLQLNYNELPVLVLKYNSAFLWPEWHKCALGCVQHAVVAMSWISVQPFTIISPSPNLSSSLYCD